MLSTPEDFQALSTILSYISTISWSLSQFPQQYKIYCLKTTAVDSISPIFLTLWLLGDLCNLIGCLLTHQLKFQLYLASYFLCNDLILIFQYYYYKFVFISYPTLHSINHTHAQTVQPTLETSQINLSSSVNKSPLLGTAAVLLTAQVSSTNALPLPSKTETKNPLHDKTLGLEIDSMRIGKTIAWSSTLIYISSRIPQLYKNFKLKTVEGISPILFASAVIGNLTYSLSILTNPDFIFGDISSTATAATTTLDQVSNSRHAYLINELPYILGSSGTLLFDFFYFYQRWLYSDPVIRTVKYPVVVGSGIDDVDEFVETSPLIQSQS